MYYAVVEGAAAHVRPAWVPYVVITLIGLGAALIAQWPVTAAGLLGSFVWTKSIVAGYLKHRHQSAKKQQ